MAVPSATNVESYPATPPSREARPTKVPRLRPGDHLTIEEFERRYEAMPEVKKAELIEGVVYMPSPVLDEHHGEAQFDFQTFLGVYRINTPGVRGSDNCTLKGLVGVNQPQPDSLLRI